MESHIVNQQIQEIKGNLARFVLAQSNSEPERVLFSRSVLFMAEDNPDMICSIYGIEKGILLFDSIHSGIESIDISALPAETLVKVKEQMEYFYREREYSHK